MLLKICLAVLGLGLVLAEPPVNNGYLPPSNGYNYPTPSIPFPPAPKPPAPRPPVFNQPPAPRPPAPRPPVPTYGPPAPRPPAPRPPVPTYGPPAPRPPAPRPPVPTYGPPAPRPPAPRPPVPSYGPPAPRPPAPRPPAPTYGPPGARPPISGISYQPGQQPGVIQNQNDIYNQGNEHHHDHVHMPGMPFDFNYAVKDDYYGTDYSHNAISDGDVIRGEYRVALPDGRLQIVTYVADWKNGYNAEVKYQGEPQYPQQQQGGNNVLASPQGPQRRPESGPY